MSFKNDTTQYQNWDLQVPKMRLSSTNFDTANEAKIPPNSASYKDFEQASQNPIHTYHRQKNYRQKYKVCEIDYSEAIEEHRQKLLKELKESDDGEIKEIGKLMKEFRQKFLQNKHISPTISARIHRIMKEKESEKEK